jgi:opacity protein-like surface antigen
MRIGRANCQAQLRGKVMKSVLAIAALAAALSTAAFAGDNKPVQMTDQQMDQVTAGSAVAGSPSTELIINNGQTSRQVFAGHDISFLGSGGETAGGNLRNVGTVGGGGSNFNFAGPGPGGGATTFTPGGTHCGGAFRTEC